MRFSAFTKSLLKPAARQCQLERSCGSIQRRLQWRPVMVPSRSRSLRTLEGTPVSIADVVARFNLVVGGRLPELPGDLAQRITDLNASVTRHEDFWADRLATTQAVAMPAARPPASDLRTDGSRFVALPVQCPESADLSATPELLIAGFCAYVARVTGQDRFDLGLSDQALRTEVSGLEALFSPAVSLRVAAADECTVETLAAALKAELALVRRRKTYPHDLPSRYPALRARLESGLPVLSIGVELGGLPASSVDSQGRQLTFVVGDNGRECHLLYDTEALTAAEAARAREQVERLLALVVTNPSAIVGELPLLSPAERSFLVEELNATRQEYGDVRPVHELFERQAARTPDAVAAVGDAGSMTYRELDAKAAQISRELRRRGVRPGVLVGIYLQRSVDMIAAVLGVLKAGGAYVPLDPEYPQDRLAFMVADSGLSGPSDASVASGRGTG